MSVNTRKLAQEIREHMGPGAVHITVYPDLIEVSGTPNDQDEVNCEASGDFTTLNIESLRKLFPGWEVTDERENSGGE